MMGITGFPEYFESKELHYNDRLLSSYSCGSYWFLVGQGSVAVLDGRVELGTSLLRGTLENSIILTSYYFSYTNVNQNYDLAFIHLTVLDFYLKWVPG